MGYTSFTIEKLEKIIDRYNPKSVIDLGAQNMYNQPLLPAPYASEWYKEKGIEYFSIDLNGENHSWEIDLSKPMEESDLFHPWLIGWWDMVVDCGTMEHVRGVDDKFSWEAIYNCFLTKHRLLVNNGLMYNENPKTQSWPLHGVSYFTETFYHELVMLTDYELLDIGEHPAMGNDIDGWNIFCTIRKHSEVFPHISEFKTMSIKQS